MATAEAPRNSPPSREQLRDRWLTHLDDLVRQVDTWARELDWSTRRIETKMEDSEIGDYQAPALLLQHETRRVLLEPIARSAPGTEGVVDLYLMPAYDDVATLYFLDGAWRLHDPFPDSSGEPGHKALTKESLREALSGMAGHAS